MTVQKTYLIIGTSAAGLAAAQKLRQIDPFGRIVCFSEEAEPPYNKCFLADFLSGVKTRSAVNTKGIDFFEAASIELHLATRITALDRPTKTVTCADGRTFSYTALLLAVGGQARTPDFLIEGSVTALFPFYTLHDACAVEALVREKNPQTVAVIGAGFTGLEVADALHKEGRKIIVIEQQDRLLARHADEEAAALIVQAMKRSGIDLMLGKKIEKIGSHTKETGSTLVFSDGTHLQVDLAVGALGSRARLELAEQAGLAIKKGGVVTNELLQTTDPSIFAAGDVAIVRNQISNESIRSVLWPDAVVQGMHAAYAMAGLPKPYAGVVPVASSSFFGLPFHSAGFLEIGNLGWIERKERTEKGYAKLILDEQGVVKGFLCMGDLVSKAVLYKRSLVTGLALNSI